MLYLKQSKLNIKVSDKLEANNKAIDTYIENKMF